MIIFMIFDYYDVHFDHLKGLSGPENYRRSGKLNGMLIKQVLPKNTNTALSVIAG